MNMYIFSLIARILYKVPGCNNLLDIKIPWQSYQVLQISGHTVFLRCSTMKTDFFSGVKSEFKRLIVALEALKMVDTVQL